MQKRLYVRTTCLDSVERYFLPKKQPQKAGSPLSYSPYHTLEVYLGKQSFKVVCWNGHIVGWLVGGWLDSIKQFGQQTRYAST